MKRIADDKVKKHLCNIEGCGKSFERKDHLTNHLNARNIRHTSRRRQSSRSVGSCIYGFS